MKVLVMGGGMDSALINLILRAASIAACEVVTKDEAVLADFVIGIDRTRADIDSLSNALKLIKCKDLSECHLPKLQQTFTPHYAKQNKRGKFKRKGE